MSRRDSYGLKDATRQTCESLLRRGRPRIPKLREAGGRWAFLSATGEGAVLAGLPPERRPPAARHASGQHWPALVRAGSPPLVDVDLLAEFLTVRLPKNGQARRELLNSAARGAIVDLAGQRTRPTDPEELVSKAAYRTLSREFVRAVAAAQATLRAAGREDEAARLDGVTWHTLRHTFASRLVAAGVDLRTVQELGGWRTLSMVQRYAHLSPGHLAAAVEKIVAASSVVVSETASVGELRQNFDSVETAICDEGVRD